MTQDKYEPISDVINSEFFNTLNPERREKFISINRQIFK